VRIILRDIGNPRAMLEALQAYGIDPVKYVKLQPACHNKGIIVDDRLVCLGSHNWSGDGTCYNRDASLIFDNPDIVAYYTKASALAPNLPLPRSRAMPALPRPGSRGFHGTPISAMTSGRKSTRFWSGSHGRRPEFQYTLKQRPRRWFRPRSIPA
jgi:hypothetical protein